MCKLQKILMAGIIALVATANAHAAPALEPVDSCTMETETYYPSTVPFPQPEPPGTLVLCTIYDPHQKPTIYYTSGGEPVPIEMCLKQYEACNQKYRPLSGPLV